MSSGSDQSRDGGCACGAVRYRATGAPMIVHCCHCGHCQRETGSAFVINFIIESDRVEHLKGEPELIKTPSASGKGQMIARCPDCKVAVWSNYSGMGDKTRFIRAGTLDEPNSVEPDVHIYTSTKLDWVALPAGKPAFAEFYPPKDVWSEDAQTRWRALQDK